MGCGPARPIKFGEDESRPGRAHYNFRGWAASWPSRSHFQIFTARPGLGHQFQPSRPGPLHFQKPRSGPARLHPLQFSDRPGPARPRQTANGKPWLSLGLEAQAIKNFKTESSLKLLVRTQILKFGLGAEIKLQEF